MHTAQPETGLLTLCTSSCALHFPGLPRLLSSCDVQCRTAQSEAEKLRSQVEKLQSENRMLRMRLGEDAPKQEPVTPRMYPSLPPPSKSVLKTPIWTCLICH